MSPKKRKSSNTELPVDAMPPEPKKRKSSKKSETKPLKPKRKKPSKKAVPSKLKKAKSSKKNTAPTKRRTQQVFSTVKIGNDENSEKLKKTLDVLMKYSTPEMSEDPYRGRSSFSNQKDTKLLPTSKDMMMVLRGCLISHRFADAARILELLSIEMGPKDHILFKGGLEVLENHPDATPDLMEYFIRNVLSLRYLNKREVLLEYMMHTLKQKQPEQVKALLQRQLRGQKLLRENPIIDHLIKAYTVLIDYIAWAEMKALNKSESEMIGLKERIVTAWSALLQLEGQWDIFVPKLIEVLEHYNEVDTAENILCRHMMANQENLNAQIFLYEYLRKYDRSPVQQVECLKSISQLSPSDPLVLDLVPILLQGNKTEKAIRLLSTYVDYPENKNSHACWKALADISKSLLECQDTKSLRKMWKKCAPYWPYYHFNPTSVTAENKNEAKLLVEKCTVCAVLQDAEEHPYFESVKYQLENSYPKYLSKLKKMSIKVKNLKAS